MHAAFSPRILFISAISLFLSRRKMQPRERKWNYATWQVERRRESVISVWNRNRERPTHIEVLSVCSADAAIQSNPIPVASNTHTNESPLSLSLPLLPLIVTFFSTDLVSNTISLLRPKFHPTGRASFSQLPMILVQCCVCISMIYFEVVIPISL